MWRLLFSELKIPFPTSSSPSQLWKAMILHCYWKDRTVMGAFLFIATQVIWKQRVCCNFSNMKAGRALPTELLRILNYACNTSQQVAENFLPLCPLGDAFLLTVFVLICTSLAISHKIKSITSFFIKENIIIS